jgi:hypothetical protein
MNPSDTELLDVNDKDKGQNGLAKEAMDRCIRIVANVNKVKQPRLESHPALSRPLDALDGVARFSSSGITRPRQVNSQVCEV